MMRALTATEVRQAVRGRWLLRQEVLPIRTVGIDSRARMDSGLFVAICGDNFDGHDFLEAAAAQGAVVAIVDEHHEIPQAVAEAFPVGVIVVEDTRLALLELAGFYRSVLAARVVAITGSNGKTTVKEMLHHILSKRLAGTANLRNNNNLIGVSLTLMGANAGDDYVITEVGTNATGEIAQLSRAIKPDIAVITSISEAHLDGLPGLREIAFEKAAILGWVGERGMGVVTADSEDLDWALKSYPRPMIHFGESDSAQLRLTAYEPTDTGSRFQINNRDWVTLAVRGKHNALNAMAAIAIAARFGFTQDDAAAAMAEFQPVAMRLEERTCGTLDMIVDCYNANPASTIAAGEVLSERPCATRRVMIVGDMLELGERADELHISVGKALGALGLDLVIGIGALGKLIAKNAGARTGSTVEFDTVAQ
ncbi:MAG: UDP-N-acetylmuramoyl-tripeptide--D-alanyl-D-alanine ligase, partial [Phycisphaerales bacterium]|nr:UDP-N-acetylmuramoyl-tripeptide--D-alanyl-D-alanine ligase [Phycisphaerales bacterium]